MSKQNIIKPWYKSAWPWILMAGPIFVVIASISMFFVAKSSMTDLVTDDYYKDGKHIDIQLHRDKEAVERHIQAKLLISPDQNAAKVFVQGDFDTKQPLNLLFMHPAKKAEDQTVKLQLVSQSNGQAEYNAVFKPLSYANHWYIRIEDTAGKWRVENTWITSQGNAIDLTPKNRLFNNQQAASAAK